MTRLIDSFQRRIDYLRVSVTDRCDLRSTYCLPKGFKGFEEPAHWLRHEEMSRLVGLFVTSNLVCGHPKRGLLEETLFVLEVRHDLTPQLIKNLRKRFGPGGGVGVCAQRFEGGDQLTMLCINRRYAN